MNAFEVNATFTPPKKGAALPTTLRLVAIDVPEAITKTTAFLKAAGCTDVVLASVRLIWPLEVWP